MRGFNSCNVFTPPVQIGPSQLLFDFNQTINDKQRVFVIRSLPRYLPPSDLAHLPQHHDVTISPDTANYLTDELIVRLARLSVPVEVINLTTGGPSM